MFTFKNSENSKDNRHKENHIQENQSQIAENQRWREAFKAP